MLLMFFACLAPSAWGIIGHPDCTQGDGHDDGVPELGVRPNINDARVVAVERFTPPVYPYRYERVCFAWLRISGTASLNFEVVFYDDDGPAGRPGTLLKAIPVLAENVSSVDYQFYSFDVIAAGVHVAEGDVYVGARWRPKNGMISQDYALAMDQSGTTAQQSGYFTSDNELNWYRIQDYGVWMAYRALFIRPTMEYPTRRNSPMVPSRIATATRCPMSATPTATVTG
jgi:hypothetical protein